jgi:hypothetical protein
MGIVTSVIITARKGEMPAAERQLNINLPENVADELEGIAQDSNLTMPQVIKTALALVKIASDASKNKQKLVIADQTGRPVKEIIIKE